MISQRAGLPVLFQHTCWKVESDKGVKNSFASFTTSTFSNLCFFTGPLRTVRALDCPSWLQFSVLQCESWWCSRAVVVWRSISQPVPHPLCSTKTSCETEPADSPLSFPPLNLLQRRLASQRLRLNAVWLFCPCTQCSASACCLHGFYFVVQCLSCRFHASTPPARPPSHPSTGTNLGRCPPHYI